MHIAYYTIHAISSLYYKQYNILHILNTFACYHSWFIYHALCLLSSFRSIFIFAYITFHKHSFLHQYQTYKPIYLLSQNHYLSMSIYPYITLPTTYISHIIIYYHYIYTRIPIQCIQTYTHVTYCTIYLPCTFNIL